MASNQPWAQILSGVRLFLAELWGVRSTFIVAAMGHVSLEPNWREMKGGERVSVLVQPAIIDTHGLRHLMVTSLGRQFVCVKGKLGEGCAHSLLNVLIADVSKGVRLEVDENTRVLTHQTPSMDIFHTAAETCAGIGVLGTGLEVAGFSVKVSNELRKPLIEFQERQGRKNFVHGDINDVHTLATMHSMCPTSALLTAGISCQPWSKLGDGKRLNDDRANTLDGVLKAGFFLRSWGILIECVTEAGQDKNVQAIIDDFCKRTHFRKSSINLHLEHIMPAKRHRWWCLLVSPVLPEIHLRVLPKMTIPPTFGDLFPVLPVWPAEQVSQLELDAYETSKFQECGGLLRCIVDSKEPVRTALHGWGNQLTQCPCTCRSFPLSDERLRRRGLHGALVLLSGEVSTSFGPLPRTRHLHPYEIAATHGVSPDWSWEPLKMGICGLGQMASPVQSLWIAAQLGQATADFMQTDCLSPEAILHQHIMQVCLTVADDHPAIGQHPNFHAFVRRVDECLGATRFTFAGPLRTAAPFAKDIDADEETPCPGQFCIGSSAHLPLVVATSHPDEHLVAPAHPGSHISHIDQVPAVALAIPDLAAKVDTLETQLREFPGASQCFHADPSLAPPCLLGPSHDSGLTFHADPVGHLALPWLEAPEEAPMCCRFSWRFCQEALYRSS